MTLKEEFIKRCLTEKDKLNLSDPMNTRHHAMFEAFKCGRESR